MRTRSTAAAAVVLSLMGIAACGSDDSPDTTPVKYGTYVRVADPSFASIEECETQKQQDGGGILFNCAQRLTLDEDGTFFRILTDIAETGTFEIEESSLVLTQDGIGSTSEIPIDEDGTLGDGWQLDPDTDSGE